MTVSDHLDIVAALREVPGVADADVEPDGDGDGLGLLRLGLAPGVDEVEVASAVGRLLRERFGLGVDAERVQLVEDMQTDAEDPAIEDDEDARQRQVPARDQAHAHHLVGVAGRRRGHVVDLRFRCTISLGDRDVGRAEGTATQSGVQRAVATATLRAVEELLGGRARFELDLVELTPTGRDRAVLVALTMLSTAAARS